MNKPIYLGLSILDLSKTVMYEFWYDYVKLKYGENAKLCSIDTESFINHVKTDHICKDIAKDVETRFDTSNFEIDRPLPKGKNKKVIGLMKGELNGQVIKEFVILKTTMIKMKKAKGTKKWVIKRKLQLKDYKNCLEAAKIENKISHSGKNKISVNSLKEDKKELKKN